MFLGSTCVACGASGELFCDRCGAQLRPATPFVVPAGLMTCTALFDYAGVGRELVVGLKYRNARSLTARAGAALAQRLRQSPSLGPIDLITWAPTSTVRRQARGFDQAELLAQVVGLRLGRPVVRVLSRAPGPAQTGRTRAERGLGSVFSVVTPGFGRARPDLTGAHVLVVDDVVTTGATLAAAARALTGAGAAAVHGAVLAHTRALSPGPHAHRPGPGPVASVARHASVPRERSSR